MIGAIAAHYAETSAGGGGTALYRTASPGGVTTILASNNTSEVVVSGMDATGITAGSPVQVLIHLWEAMNKSGSAKGSIARLRDGGPTGTVLDSFTFTDGGDATHGHQQGWIELQTVTPATTRLCVTIQQTAGSPQITSDWRFLEIVQPPAYLDYVNPTATGNRELAGSGERIISDMDYAGLQAGVSTAVSIDLWLSQNAPGSPKSMTARLRDGGPTGTVLASQAFGDTGDSSGGHAQRWQHSANYTPTTGRMCVTVQPNVGSVFSDTRTFTLTQ